MQTQIWSVMIFIVMNSDNDGDSIMADCKENEDCIIVSDKYSPKRCKLEVEKNLYCKLTPGDDTVLPTDLQYIWRKSWQRCSEIGHRVSNKFAKVQTMFWI